MSKKNDQLQQRLAERYARCLFGDFSRGNLTPIFSVNHSLMGVSFECRKSRRRLRSIIRKTIKPLLNEPMRPRHKLTLLTTHCVGGDLIITAQFKVN